MAASKETVKRIWIVVAVTIVAAIAGAIVWRSSAAGDEHWQKAGDYLKDRTRLIRPAGR